MSQKQISESTESKGEAHRHSSRALAGARGWSAMVGGERAAGGVGWRLSEMWRWRGHARVCAERVAMAQVRRHASVVASESQHAYGAAANVASAEAAAARASFTNVSFEILPSCAPAGRWL